MTARGEIEVGDSFSELRTRALALAAELVIFRVPTSEIKIVQEAQQCGALLADTLVYFEKWPTDRYDVSLPSGFSHRLAGPADADEVETIARLAFKGYFGHYHADSRLSQDAADETYASWARRSCSGAPVADAVIILQDAHTAIVGFLTVRTDSSQSFSIELNAISPRYQGQGLYPTLVQLAQNWGLETGCQRLAISTQVDNLHVQRVWCRLGLEPFKSYYTLHLWMS